MKPNTARAIVGVTIMLSSFSLLAQETAAQRHAIATNQLKEIAADISLQCLTDIRTLEDWKKQRPELRRQLLEMLGLDPLPARTSLKAQITGRLERDTYRIEKIILQSLPGLYVTGNFYVPNGPAKSLPTILYLCGHSPHPLGAKVEYQDRAHWFASHGYPCLVLDTLEFGEVAGIHHGTHNLNMWNSERIREVDDNVGHSDPPLFLREARRWMQRWLKGDPTPLREETNTPPKEAAEDLACLSKLPTDAINYKVPNQFTTSATLKNPASRAAWATRRAELTSRLKEKVFRWFPTGKIPFQTQSVREERRLYAEVRGLQRSLIPN